MKYTIKVKPNDVVYAYDESGKEVYALDEPNGRNEHKLNPESKTLRRIFDILDDPKMQTADLVETFEE